jgi:diguanylate cyclase (GGDEF)-like protein
LHGIDPGNRHSAERWRILLIEHGALDAFLARETLRDALSANAEVEHRRTLAEGLERLRETGFDAVLVDPRLLDRSPEVAVEDVVAASGGAPVIVLAANADPARADRFLLAGAQDYILKGDMSPRTLSRALRHAIQRQQAVSRLRRARRRAEYLATHDALTGLPGRALFEDRVRQGVSSAERFGRSVAVLFLDLDGFKPVNDRHGHDVGDRLLQQVARRLRSSLRDSDTAARLGGDEFGVVGVHLESPRDVHTIARGIVARLSRPYRVGGRRIRVTVSVGAAVGPVHGREVAELVRLADAAMYRAKRGGRNRWVVHRADRLPESSPPPLPRRRDRTLVELPAKAPRRRVAQRSRSVAGRQLVGELWA